jgi:methylmalonyl-CoA mutase|nr:methylmalonyl-CoA mutase family protein [Kofleriaceae bacterium]
MATLDAWRALVDKELAGAPFDRLVQRTADGLAIEPLYTTAPAGAARPAMRGEPIRVCMRARPGEALEHLDGGADALWLDARDVRGLALATERGAVVVVDGKLDARGVRVSTRPWHDAGADAADELALALSSAVAQLRAERPADQLWFQVAVGRDTFGELCKLRALRVVVAKLLAACGADAPIAPPIHAVCSERTLAARDPWVNLLRVTTQVFAAAIGGADLVTPLAFDSALADQSDLGQRVARNTALVLRDESQLGRVIDAAGGSYYLESRTDGLAREAWRRFQAIERGGGVAKLSPDALRERFEATWRARAAAIAKRKEPVLGVSEFVNLDEVLPSPPVPTRPGLHRDAETFEALRAMAEVTPRAVAIAPLGPPAEHRARVGYTEGLFAVAGLRATVGDAHDIAVICGSDDRYAIEAAATARALRAAGARRVVLAGKPGALEAELRAAGVDAFIYVGCDVRATLEELLR